MSTVPQASQDVLYATDTALRLVHQVLGDLGTAGAAAADAVAAPPAVVAETSTANVGGLVSIAETLLKAHGDVATLLERIRQSRGIIQEAQDAQLEQMNSKLSAVTSATETAATGMLDGLDRAMVLVGELERGFDGTDAALSGRFATLKDELFGVMAHLQFQDITSQQLGYASAVIRDTERRLELLAELFAPFASDAGVTGTTVPLSAPAHFDPNAVADKAASQALADALFDTR